MDFVKMQGTGNDFIMIEDFEGILLKDEETLAKKLCNRRFGIGADGLVIVKKSNVANYKMEIINSDGSRAEMCGNAIRCFGKYLYTEGLINSTLVSVETGDGVKELEILLDKDGNVAQVKVCMGVATFHGETIGLDNRETLINEAVSIEDKEYLLTTVNCGVPHTIIFTEDNDVLASEGKNIEKYHIFKYGTNVNFVKIINRGSIKVTTWERGAGATLSCGTGASASVFVSNYFKKVDDIVDVEVPGGHLIIELKDEKVFMSGPAEIVFKGIVY